MNRLHSVSLITRDPEMLRLIDKVNKVVDSNSSILLIGETGTGKEVFALGELCFLYARSRTCRGLFAGQPYFVL